MVPKFWKPPAGKVPLQSCLCRSCFVDVRISKDFPFTLAVGPLDSGVVHRMGIQGFPIGGPNMKNLVWTLER